MQKITQDGWIQFLTEERIPQEKWCDITPADYGFELVLPKENVLLSYLRLWKEHYLSGETLLQKLNTIFIDSHTNPAELRQLIKELRLKGHIIIASNKGYMLTDNLELIGKYVKSRWGELTREMKVLRAMDYACNGVGQWTIEELENNNDRITN